MRKVEKGWKEAEQRTLPFFEEGWGGGEAKKWKKSFEKVPFKKIVINLGRNVYKYEKWSLIRAEYSIHKDKNTRINNFV